MDKISLKAYRASVAKSLQKCFAAWSVMPPDVWATEIYRLPNGGRFRWEYAPYSRAMFNSLFDHHTIETVFQLYSRGLKSTVILIAIGFIIDQAPRRILSLWPTNSQAEKWSKDILCGELFNTTPCLNFLGNETGRRIASNTLLHKLFPGGLIDMFGANAPGDMRRAKGSFLYADEIDAIDSTVTDEGDQLAIFNKRGDEYPDTIRVFASYPSILGESRINAKLLETDYNEWHVTCALCGGEPFVMHRTQLRYDNGRPQTALLECPKCKELLKDSQRHAMMLSGSWKPRNEFRGKRGFHGNAMLWPHPVDSKKYPGGFLQMVAQAEIDAEKSDNVQRSRRVIVNTVDSEPFNPASENEAPPDWKPLFDRREKYAAKVPAGGLVLTAMVDLQINRLEIEWRAWGRGEESWGIEYVVIDGDVRNSAEPWNQLRRELARRFEHEIGADIGLSFALIDGGKWGDAVYYFLRELASNPVEGVTGKVRGSKGVGLQGHPVIDMNFRTIAKQLKGHNIGTWAAKDIIYSRLKMKPEPDGTLPKGYAHFPMSYDENYFRQLTCEKVTIEYKGGEEVRKYVNPDHARNEALDLFVGNLAAFRRRGWNFDLIEADLMERAKPVQEETEPRIEPRYVTPGRGWGL